MERQRTVTYAYELTYLVGADTYVYVTNRIAFYLLYGAAVGAVHIGACYQVALCYKAASDFVARRPHQHLLHFVASAGVDKPLRYVEILKLPNLKVILRYVSCAT